MYTTACQQDSPTLNICESSLKGTAFFFFFSNDSESEESRCYIKTNKTAEKCMNIFNDPVLQSDIGTIIYIYRTVKSAGLKVGLMLAL